MHIKNYIILALVVITGVSFTQANKKELQDRLLVAVGNNDIEAIKSSLAAGADVNAGEKGWPLLHMAVTQWPPRIDVLNMLLAAGAKVNVKDERDGFSPLWYAVIDGNIDVIRTLLAAGADVNAQNNELLTPLHASVAGAAEGGIDVIKVLLAAGAQVNAREIGGETPLFWAAKNEKVESVKELIAAGADVNAKNSKGKSVLQGAVDAAKLPHHTDYSGNIAVIKLLISSGADYSGLAEEPLIRQVLREKLV